MFSWVCCEVNPGFFIDWTINTYMKFSFSKKKEDTSRTLEGRIISDEEFNEMIKPKTGTFIKKDFKEIKEMMEDVKKLVD